MTSTGDSLPSAHQDSSISDAKRAVSDSSTHLYPNRDRPPSPTSTLQDILLVKDSTASGFDGDAPLLTSFQSASTDELKFAKYVLDTTLSLKAWSEKLNSWTWPGRFDFESSENGAFQNSQALRHESGSPKSLHIAQFEGTALANSAPASSIATQLSAYVEPLCSIQADLDDIDIIGMKNHILDTYLSPGRAESVDIQSDLLRSQHTNADNFKSLVTVVLLQALPYHAQVASLTETWAARISVSKLIPNFFTLLSQSMDSLGRAWEAIGLAHSHASNSNLPVAAAIKNEEELAELKGEIRNKISSVGRVLDYMLDLLEGLEDALPDLWIDQVDELEEEYSDWTVAAHNWLIQQQTEIEEALPVASQDDILSPTSQERTVDLDEFHGTSYLADASESESEGKTTVNNDEAAVFSDDSHLPHSNSKSESEVLAKQQDVQDTNPSGMTTSTFFDSEDESNASDTDNSTVIQSVLLSPSSRNLDQVKEEGSLIVEEDEDEDADEKEVNLLLEEYGNEQSSPILEADEDEQTQTGVYGSRDITASLPGDQPREFDQVDHNSDGIEDDEDVEGSEVNTVDEEPVVIDYPAFPAVPGQETKPYIEQEAESGPIQSSQKIRNQPLSTDEQLERQIDSILTSIPTRINFKRTRLNQSTSLHPSTPESKSVSGSRSFLDANSRPGTPALTLAPAETKEPRAAKFSGDSPIRLYYLWQAGRPKPIKLFVRLVGEHGERVMVRVGGGWADLGDYLREYATHHSRTIIPEPHESLQAVDLRQPSNSRVFSLPLARPETSASSSPPHVDSTGADTFLGSSPTQRVSQTPDGSLQLPKNRFNGKLFKQHASPQQDLFSAGVSKGLEDPGTAEQWVNEQDKGSLLGSGQESWVGGVVSDAQELKVDQDTSQPPSSTSPQVSTVEGIRADGSAQSANFF